MENYHSQNNGFFPLFSEWFLPFIPVEWDFVIIFWMAFFHHFQNGFFPLFSECVFSIIFRMVFFHYFQNGFLKKYFFRKIIKENYKENLKKKIFHPFQNGKYSYFPEWIFSIFSRMGINHSCIWMEYFHPLAGWHINLA